jgi:phospholipase D1/2
MLATSEAPSGGASGIGANGAGGPLYNDAPGHGHRPQIHHHDHHKQQKMPQAGMHGAGIAMAEGLGGRMGSGRGEPRPYIEEGHDTQADTMAELVKDKVLLHGTLDVEIIQAENLPNMDMFSEKFRQCFSYLTVCKAPFVKAKTRMEEKGHGHRPKGITSDPYAAVNLAGARVARTRVISNNTNPEWKEHFSIPVAHYVNEVQVTVKDNDMLGAQHIGEVNIPVDKVIHGQVVEGWHDVLNANGKPVHRGARIRFKMQFIPVEKNPIYTGGVGDPSKLHGVPNTYFPCRIGGNLIMYQDAHIMDGTLPKIRLDGGKSFQHRGAWEELCTAILEAHHLVYICGWSIYTKVRLVRDTTREIPEGADMTLGDLLKRKSAEGVRVLLLVWDDKTSHRNPFIKTEGVMGVHDEETKSFFRNSAVRCVLAPRYGDSKLSWFRQQVVGTLYTHHQKCVIVDSQGPGNKRKVTSFIGGLDLCDGRFDTPSHPLFSTLNTFHKNDYHNPTFPEGAEAGGPRQPWHDWHCRIDGPAAYDVLKNFEQRWRKATHRHDDELIQIERISWILGPKGPKDPKGTKDPPEGDPQLYVTKENDPETWHIQVFRSIDSGSVKGFPNTVMEAEKQHLVWGKSIAIDISIQMAYIKAIRSAQHFVWIENQYFIGSSYNWPDYKNAGANHLIPMELALKIASKIREGQHFAVYVVLPMWPEGVPDSAAMQEILYFQTQTMKMMYGVIADALKDVGKLGERHPRDYLNFYCLGNRETMTENEKNHPPTNPPDPNSKHGQSLKHRRFMIYVHAKGMVVDDEYIICGSANINQRSMDGSRDTEIAMGAYQPRHSWHHKRSLPLGQVYGYRMSLWAEHLGHVQPLFHDAGSLECVTEVNRLAKGFWEQFTSDEVRDMRGHLLPYPININADGTVGPLEGFETFPDVGGNILGTNQANLPDSLTT